jgi:hypothetical protein
LGQEGVQELDDVPWWFASFDGSFVFLDVWGPSFFVLCIPPLFGCFDLFMIIIISLYEWESPPPYRATKHAFFGVIQIYTSGFL